MPIFETPVLSDGTVSTLGRWRQIALEAFGPESPAVKFLDEKIAKSGEDNPVLTPQGQMLDLIASMAK